RDKPWRPRCRLVRASRPRTSLTDVIGRSSSPRSTCVCRCQHQWKTSVPLSGHGLPPSASVESANRTRRLARIAPGLSALLGYRFSDVSRHDAIAGLWVAAVALPVSIAYAQLAGFDPVVGLYSSILPLVAYAIFGTSRQLMVNPDAAACAMIAAA